jgi:hypothetical protein
MRLTLIVDEADSVIGATQGHAADHEGRGLRARPVAGPGQRLVEVIVPDEIVPPAGEVAAAADFLERLQAHVPGRSGGKG